ncbi:MAG: HNH endonuclease [Actinomycetota bacterium]|nr:HNH endonuclease [Actinomycetota bacterium]
MSIDEATTSAVPPDPGGCEAFVRSTLQAHRTAERNTRTDRKAALRRLELRGARRDRLRRKRWTPLPGCRAELWPAIAGLIWAPDRNTRISATVGGTVDEHWISEVAAVSAGAIDDLTPAALLQLTSQLSRVISWAQATQADVIAAFARPGVGVPVGEVLESLLSAASDTRVHASYPLQPRDSDLQADTYQQTSLAGDPLWDALVPATAARLAAVEVAATLTLPPVTAQSKVAEALTFVDELSLTLDAWRAGRIDRGRALTIADRISVLDADRRLEVEQRTVGEHAECDAGLVTVSRLKKLVDRIVIEVDADAASRRAAKAQANRKVQVIALPDEMARFSAEVQAPVALLAKELLDSVANSLPTEARAGRTLDQSRADIFADIVTSLATYGHLDLSPDANGPDVNGPCGNGRDVHGPDLNGPDAGPAGPGESPAGDRPGVQSRDFCRCSSSSERAQWQPLGSSVAVTVAASTLAGLDDDAAQLAGYGWITADLARAIARSARSVRTIVIRDDGGGTLVEDPSRSPGPPTRRTSEPASPDTRTGGDGLNATCGHQGCAAAVDTALDRYCGTELDFGRSVYRPPAALRELIENRDVCCRFPGCRMPSKRCDTDHRRPFGEDGVTCPCNLDSLCRFHHRAKTFTRWRAVRLPGNRLSWTSPHGLRVVDDPDCPPLGSALPLNDPPPF